MNPNSVTIKSEPATSDSEEDEEFIVYANFMDSFEDNVFNPDNLQVLNILGINEKHPIIQVNNSFFEGTYQRSLGTHLFLSEADAIETEDPIFEPAPVTPLKFDCKTRKILQMKRVFLEKHVNDAATSNVTIKPTIKVERFKNEQEATAEIIREFKLKPEKSDNRFQSKRFTSKEVGNSSERLTHNIVSSNQSVDRSVDQVCIEGMRFESDSAQMNMYDTKRQVLNAITEKNVTMEIDDNDER